MKRHINGFIAWVTAILIEYRILATPEEDAYYSYWDQEYEERGQ